MKTTSQFLAVTGLAALSSAPALADSVMISTIDQKMCIDAADTYSFAGVAEKLKRMREISASHNLIFPEAAIPGIAVDMFVAGPEAGKDPLRERVTTGHTFLHMSYAVAGLQPVTPYLMFDNQTGSGCEISARDFTALTPVVPAIPATPNFDQSLCAGPAAHLSFEGFEREFATISRAVEITNDVRAPSGKPALEVTFEAFVTGPDAGMDPTARTITTGQTFLRAGFGEAGQKAGLKTIMFDNETGMACPIADARYDALKPTAAPAP